jgi:hypothetical protein
MRNVIYKNNSIRYREGYAKYLVESGVLQRPLFESRKSVLVSMALIDPPRPLVTEGLGSGVLKDLIQWAVSGAAEYGIGGITLPAGGAGLAIGPAVETAVDALFATDAVAGAVATVKDFATGAADLSDMLNDVVQSARDAVSNPMGFYNTVSSIVRTGIRLLGKKAGEGVEKIAEKLQNFVENAIDKLTDALVKGIKTLLPDATIGAGVSTAIRSVLSTLSDNSYTILSSAIAKAGEYVDFLRDPSVATDYFSDLIDQVSDMLLEYSKKMDNTSWAETLVKSALSGASGISQIAKKLSPAALEKAASLLQDKKGSLLSLIETVVGVIIPAAMGMAAIYQILLTDDYKTDAGDTTSPSPAT